MASGMRPAGREGDGVHQRGFRAKVTRGECQAKASRRLGQRGHNCDTLRTHWLSLITIRLGGQVSFRDWT